MQDKNSGEGGNIFNVKVPVAISILIKDSANKKEKAEIYYYDIGDYLDRQTKLNIIKNLKSIENLESKFKKITPNKDFDWINQRDYSYLKFIKMGDKNTKLKDTIKTDIDIFRIFSMGISTARDSWVFNFSKVNLESNMSKMIENYNAEVEKFKKDSTHKPTMDKTKIKWADDLNKSFSKKITFKFDPKKITIATYRPFTKCYLYLDKVFNERLYQMLKIYPKTEYENLTICISDKSAIFSTFIVNNISCTDLIQHTQCFPLYYYYKNDISGDYEKIEALRDEALEKFRAIYNDKSITKEAIFYYIYAILNHPKYKEKYKDNLSKMLPRIPFVRGFREFEKYGRELANLHINYESFSETSSAKACLKSDIKMLQSTLKNGNLLESEASFTQKIEALSESDYKITKLKFEKNKKDVIIFNDKIAVINISPKAHKYQVNGKSAIEWIIDRYQVKTDTDSLILNDPNLYVSQTGALRGLSGGKYVLKLLLSVIEMSVKSVEIIESMESMGELEIME